MNRARRTRMLQRTAYLISLIVALSMILSLLGPALARSARPRTPTPRPTATWPPTWTAVPTLSLATPMLIYPLPPSTASPTITPTLTITSAATP